MCLDAGIAEGDGAWPFPSAAVDEVAVYLYWGTLDVGFAFAADVGDGPLDVLWEFGIVTFFVG